MDPRFRRRDYYRVLHVDPTAHPEVIRAAYRALLRALGKHPDLGGDGGEARTIIEAYETLGNRERRQAYDRWLKAHSVPAAPASALSADAEGWIRAVLPEWREAPKAPFAGRFELVLEAPAPSSERLYVKALPILGREHWPTVFTLCRAVAVGRTGIRPSVDVVMLVAGRTEDLSGFLEEAVHHSVQWAWNRCLVAVCTLPPIRLHSGRIAFMPSSLRRLQAAT